MSIRHSALAGAVILGLVAMVATGSVAVLPPDHANAAPIEPLFPADIDAYADYDGADTCSDYAKPGAIMLLDLLREAYPGTDGYIARDCDTGGSSEHHEGRAIDWMISASDQGDLADDLFAWLLAKDAYTNTHAMVRRLGIMYIIWNHQVWRAYSPEDGWQPYNGSNPHTDHVHISMSWDGALEETTWTTKPDVGRRLDQARYSASWRDRSRLDVFRRGVSGDLEQRTYQGGWSGWTSLGGDLESGPAAVWSSHNSLWVFGQGNDGKLHMRRWRAASGWHGWRATGASISAAPGVAATKGRIDLVVRTPAGSVSQRTWRRGGGWSHWKDRGGLLTAPPAAVWSSRDRLDVYARGEAGMLHQRSHVRGTAWGAWSSLGGELTSGPAATSYAAGQASVFVRTERGSIGYRERGSEWSDWRELGGLHVSGGAVTSVKGVRTDLFTRHAGGGLYQNYYSAGSGWSGWNLR